MDQLADKVAVITGGASGMGRAFADRLAAAGTKLVLADIEEPALDAAVAELEAAGATVIGVVTDASDEASNRALYDATIEAFGGVNLVFLNAGVAGGGRLHEATTRDWQWTLGVNLWGIVHGLQAFLGHLREHGDGHVVITASVAGHTSYSNLAPYSVSKHAAATIAETLHHELTEDGCDVGVTCLCPGLVSTNIMQSERNRPEQLQNPGMADLPDADAAARAEVMADVFSNAKPPAEVADLVHDAILDRQFWLFTDTQFDQAIAQRHTEIQQRTTPSLRAGLVEEGIADH